MDFLDYFLYIYIYMYMCVYILVLHTGLLLPQDFPKKRQKVFAKAQLFLMQMGLFV